METMETRAKRWINVNDCLEEKWGDRWFLVGGTEATADAKRKRASRLFMFIHPAIKAGSRSGGRPLRLQVSVAAILSTNINSGVWRTHTPPSRTNDFVSVKFHSSSVRRTSPSIPNEIPCLSQSVIKTICGLFLKKKPCKATTVACWYFWTRPPSRFITTLTPETSRVNWWSVLGPCPHPRGIFTTRHSSFTGVSSPHPLRVMKSRLYQSLPRRQGAVVREVCIILMERA